MEHLFSLALRHTGAFEPASAQALRELAKNAKRQFGLNFKKGREKGAQSSKHRIE